LPLLGGIDRNKHVWKGGGGDGGDAGGVRTSKRRSERRNSKSKEGLKRRKTNDFNFKKKTDGIRHR
jgi:hypothetical protein